MGGSGPGQPSGQSGLGTRVRRSSAVLSFSPALFTDPSGQSLRVIRWQEAGRVLWVSSSNFPGGDLLRVAWELDETTAPRPSYVRVRDGACASTTKPEDTIDRLMALIGSAATGCADYFSDLDLLCVWQEVLDRPRRYVALRARR